MLFYMLLVYMALLCDIFYNISTVLICLMYILQKSCKLTLCPTKSYHSFTDYVFSKRHNMFQCSQEEGKKSWQTCLL